MPTDSVKKPAVHPLSRNPARFTSTAVVPKMAKRDTANELARSATTATTNNSNESVQQLRRSLDAVRYSTLITFTPERAKLSHLFSAEARDSLRRCRAEMAAEFRRQLNAEQQKWQAGKEKALAANTAHLRRVFDEKLTTALRSKDKELNGLRARLRSEINPSAATATAAAQPLCDGATDKGVLLFAR